MLKCTPTNRVNQFLPATLSDVDTLLGQFFPGAFASAPVRTGRPAWGAAASLWEADDRLHVEIDAPGVAADDVEVTVENGRLSITLRRSAGENPPAYLSNERRFGEVTRTLDLPDTVDPDSVGASLTNGVLHVTVAKRPETQPRKVEVRRG